MAESPSSTKSPAPIAEIDHGPSKLDQFLEDHSKKLVIAAILIALGVVAYVVYDGLAEAKAQEAGSALLEAQKVADYQDVIKKWPDSNAAASALPLMAELQWTDSQPDSIATLEEFISKHPGHPSIATAKVSLGLRLLEQGKTDEASEILSEIADSDKATYIAPLACIALGDIAKAANKPDDAKQWYEKAQTDPSEQGNAFKDIAAARLILVNAKPPVKIKPALPEPPKPDSPATPTVPAPLLEQPDTPETAPETAPETTPQTTPETDPPSPTPPASAPAAPAPPAPPVENEPAKPAPTPAP
ncbi:MAG: tetratricopeptide repeat protein [Akkermansiaceae bacterium]|nr:tetratricopeptide repeat protein [Akkermansiaceae bacterium]